MEKNCNLKDLANVDPLDSEVTQPEWITEEYPEFTEHHGHHMNLVNTDTFEYQGNKVEIRNEIKVTINGQPVMLHANFTEDDKVQCHNVPYIRTHTLQELIKLLIDNTPKDAIPSADCPSDQPHSHHHHS